jgi:hypothetical protein
MKATIFIQLTVLLLCAGLTDVFGQSKIQKEKDEKENVSFAKVTKDTVFRLKDAPKLLKELQPDMKAPDEWKSMRRYLEYKEQ